MAERSYYLEKAKLEKEGLDPVSNFFFSAIFSTGSVMKALGKRSPLFCFLFFFWGNFHHFVLLDSELACFYFDDALHSLVLFGCSNMWS